MEMFHFRHLLNEETLYYLDGEWRSAIKEVNDWGQYGTYIKISDGWEELRMYQMDIALYHLPYDP